MIPIKLTLSGFLSYHNPVEVDFSSFDLACISGHNGAGKSSLLDAITWVLFGQARKKDDALINSTSNRAEVTFVFKYEQNIYRIQRSMPRGKTGDLQLQIKDQNGFRPFGENSIRNTQNRIQNILRMDYDTFVNASFFLQGKADQFTQQRPADRKKILASILGLEIWEQYRERTQSLRKSLENDLAILDGQITEINRELSEETLRYQQLHQLEAELTRTVDIRKSKEAVLISAKQMGETITHQQNMVDTLAGQIKRVQTNLTQAGNRKISREAERQQLVEIRARSNEVEMAHKAWRDSRLALERWVELESQFRTQEKARSDPISRLSSIQARLEHEMDNLRQKEVEIEQLQEQMENKKTEHTQLLSDLTNINIRAEKKIELENKQSSITKFRELASLRYKPQSAIDTEKARIEKEIKQLESQKDGIDSQRSALVNLEAELLHSKMLLTQAEAQQNLRKELEVKAQLKKEENLILLNENERLKAEMNTLNERKKKLEVTDGALCPLCGQPLGQADRQKLITDIHNEGTEKGITYRNNITRSNTIQQELGTIQKEMEGYSRSESDYRHQLTNVTKIEERIKTNQENIQIWMSDGEILLVQLREQLLNDDYSLDARMQVAQIDIELKKIASELSIQLSQSISFVDTIQQKISEVENELNQLKKLDDERMQLNIRIAGLNAQLDSIAHEIDEWKNSGLTRLQELTDILSTSNFGIEEREILKKIDSVIYSIGYDPALHEATRQAELAGRNAENELRSIQNASAALTPLERELDEIYGQINELQIELSGLQKQHDDELIRLSDLKSNMIDIRLAEKMVMDAQERENILHREVGAAQQKVNVLPEQRRRKAAIESKREEVSRQITHHKTLERAFGKDGVPALLIEQALPMIEERANLLLEKLSNGTMSVRFATQSEYKDKKREDMKETLDILISDGSGTRDYEMFSGGEAFRVNFAIRLALSEILAQRTGARLQTLVIDEGFGSQDAQGRQRLIEAINQVKPDFAKILIITHLDELKEAFPNRIEVEKTLDGSHVRIM